MDGLKKESQFEQKEIKKTKANNGKDLNNTAQIEEIQQKIEVIPGQVFLIIKNGFLEQITRKEFEDNKEQYKIYDRTKIYNLLNYDSKNLKPYVWDILNRKHDFIEIKLLKSILLVCFVMILFLMFSYYKINKEIKAGFGTTSTNISSNINGIGKGIENIQNEQKKLFDIGVTPMPNATNKK